MPIVAHYKKNMYCHTNPNALMLFPRSGTPTLLASVECACRARHAQLQKTHLRHAQKKRKKEREKKKKKNLNSDTPCVRIRTRHVRK